MPDIIYLHTRCRIAKLPKGKQYPKNVADRKKEHKVEEKNTSVVEENSVSDVVQGNNNQAIIEDYVSKQTEL